MRQSIAFLSAVFLATAVATAVSLLVFHEASGARTPSQGSVAKGPGLPEEDFPAYSQIVDNSSSGRFEAPGWDTKASSTERYGEDYRVVKPSGRSPRARYKVEIPATDTYSIYAWWPSAGVDNISARYGISTTSGVRWTAVDQREDGGSWVKLGEYKMKRGDRYAVQVALGSDKKGSLVADAVAVVRGVQSAPPERSYELAAGEETMFTAQGRRPSRKAIIRQARKHLGTRYVLSPPGPCRAFRKEDCSCHTKVVFRRFGKRLPDHPARQWKKGRRVAKANVRRGDLVFFKENGRNITHVGIYSGNGNVIHASSYFGKVVESKMKYIRGYIGGRRLGW